VVSLHRFGPTGAIRTNLRGTLVLAIALVLVVGLVGATQNAAPRSAAAATTPPTSSSTVWLCRPGLSNNPCTRNLTTTIVRPNGTRIVQRAVPAKNPPIDCFYVYPTVSTESSNNSDLRIQPAEQGTAEEQASRFSQVCRVYAPMYRQLTTAALDHGAINPRTTAIAYRSMLAGWNSYLANYNRGRGVVLIGHSQGAALLIGLIKREIETKPAEKKLLVSALLMGGNVAVPTGKLVGGDFKSVAACQSNSQTGCVIAYSTFDAQPPANTLFGRLATSINGNDGIESTRTKGFQVLCTNPAALAGGAGPLLPYFPSQGTVSTPWVSYPNLYRAQCKTAGGATWLQVTDIAGPKDPRPVVQQTLGPDWGLHAEDVNLALGNLVPIVQDEATAYMASSSGA
jgi:Protein of unknown function (DUF3089)